MDDAPSNDAPDIDELLPPERTLMGPGPSDVHPRVCRAIMAPVVGHLDDFYVEVMDDVQAGLRYLFRTDNEHTFAVTGTGSAAMETAFGNLVEPVETVVVPDNGYFGDRVGQVAERAVEKIRSRESQPRSWYLDFDGVWEYWGDERNYHHTDPISTMYALRESLRLVSEEGIAGIRDRHERVAGALKAGVEAMGLSLNAAPDDWLPTLSPVTVPDGVDDSVVIERLMDEHGIEIVGGLGALAGEIFRVGCMGHSARPGKVTQFVSAFGSVLADEGAVVDVEAGAGAVARALGGDE
jgi:aspartate aminotransferase-like enzyme